MPYKDDSKNKEYKRQWYLNNRDRILKEAKTSYHDNPIPKIEQVRKYRRDNPLKAKEYYSNNKSKNIESVLNRRDRNKEEAILSKGGKCEICGFEYNGKNAACFDFHHINPDEKKYNPSTALRLSKENRNKELSKCLLVCANCHRLIHNSRDVK